MRHPFSQAGHPGEASREGIDVIVIYRMSAHL
jgi:hypothetical protein